jgi:hypothetical protein
LGKFFKRVAGISSRDNKGYNQLFNALSLAKVTANGRRLGEGGG